MGSLQPSVKYYLLLTDSWIVFSLLADLRKYLRYTNAKGNNVDWDVVKVHAISHFREDIMRSGTTQHYSAELYENLHQTVKYI